MIQPFSDLDRCDHDAMAWERETLPKSRSVQWHFARLIGWRYFAAVLS